MTEKMRPFRDLLKPKVPFYWDRQLQQLFNESKQHIVEAIQQGARIFEKGRKTCLATDWSKDGIGFFLLQKNCTCRGDAPFCCPDRWRVTLVGSRFTHPAESRYAPIEGEALAVADALERTRYFVLGCDDLIVAVDHQPLLKVLGDRKLEDIKNPRLFNLKEKTLPFKFKIIHIPGKKHLSPDALSRHPVGDQDDKLMLPDDVHTMFDHDNTSPWKGILSGFRIADSSLCATIDSDITIAAIHALDDMRAVTWDRVREATMSDPVMFELLETIEDGMPDCRSKLSPLLRQYHNFRDELSTTDGVILYKDRIVIPPALRDEVLSALHSAHQGISSMTARANMSIFWPGITTHIADLRERCADCNRIAPSQPNAPPTALVESEYPFQCICADFFSYKGVHYLIIVDRYSNWPIIKRTNRSSGLVKCLREEFVTYGVPVELSSDGGPEFVAAETQSFLKAWGVHHRISSVAFPHSNCRAEVGVKTCKRLIMNNTGPNGELDVAKFQQAVLQYRNTPDQDTKMSPAMIVFGRCVRDLIPVLPGRYKPQQAWVDNAGQRETALRKRHLRTARLLHAHTKKLPPLRVGDHVRIQNQIGSEPLKWDKTGVVVEVKQHDQYVIRVDGSGRVTLRNRKFLRKFNLYQPSRHCPLPATQCPTQTPTKSSTHSHMTPIPGNLSPPPPIEPGLKSPPRPIATSSTEPQRCQNPTFPIVFEPTSTDLEPSGDITSAGTPVTTSEVSTNQGETAAPTTPNTNRRPKRNIKPPSRYDPAEWEL